MTKQLLLNHNKVVLIDDDDLERVSLYRWCARESNGNWYAQRTIHLTPGRKGKHTTQSMHVFLMGPPSGLTVDHINGNGLDNRRENLRICTHSQNSKNRRRKINNTSGYTGVHFYKRLGRWGARIGTDGKRIFLGLFDSKEHAAEVRRQAEQKYFGEFAPTKRITST